MLDFNNFLQSKVERSIKNLYLQFLYILEDLVATENLSEEEYSRLRKRVLDGGNACSRDIAAQIKEFRILLAK